MDIDTDSLMELSFQVGAPLSSSQAASLVEAGLTYLLYQRGQIPLPYQGLQVSALNLEKLQLSSEERGDSQGSECGDLSHNVLSVLEESNLNPRQRMSAMNEERKLKRLRQKMEKQRRLGLENEAKAYHQIQPAVEMLHRLLSATANLNAELSSSRSTKKIISVALLLGPSVYCPKEIYHFDLPCHWICDESNTISQPLRDQFQTTVLRQFYKKLITSADLMDFTEKPLPKTYAHICIISLGNLNSVLVGDYYKHVNRLPGIPPSLLESLQGPGLKQNAIPEKEFSFPRRKRNKCFRIKLQSYLNKHTSFDSVSCDGSSFSSDILFDSNSFSCYQIPLRFKGVQCKNKRL